jgi:2-dehydro-3-deoxyphosphogluconate aldolase/(4S)-4-hydroxy-2-oxoglutarate aldolase
MQAVDIMRSVPVIPVLTIDSVEDAVPLARALATGGLTVLEVTLRTPAGLEAIARIAAGVPDALVGAGTVTRAEEFTAIRGAGARFAVSPGYTAALDAAAGEMPWLPGVATASEIMAAGATGRQALKFFPAEVSGGIAALKAFAGPFGDVVFCPTGGIGHANAADYLALPNVACVGGSWVAPAQAVADKDWRRIEMLAAEAAALA